MLARRLRVRGGRHIPERLARASGAGRSLASHVPLLRSAVFLVLLVILVPLGARGDSLAAELLFPTPGSTLADLKQPFRWTAVPAAQSYMLVVGSSPGQADFWKSGDLQGTSAAVTRAPVPGQVLYARVWTTVQGILRPSADVRFTVTPASAGSLGYPNGKLPIVWEGQEIVFPGNVNDVRFFVPLFGAERADVNPAPPKVTGSAMLFPKAGEYYVTVNGEVSLKVVVLGLGEPLSSAVVRIFDFVRANVLFDTCHDDTEALFYADQEGYARRFFESAEPVALLCGPAHSLFQRLVQESLGLPTRKPSFPGTTRWSDENCNTLVFQLTHNPLEVYLPDRGKWALFDVNFGFLAKWLDAAELVEFTMATTGPGTLGYMGHAALRNLDLYTAGPATRLCRPPLPGEDPHPPVRQRVSGVPTAYNWKDDFRFYYGGVAYWGETSAFQMPHGTEFLSGDYVWASRHWDRDLERAAVEWWESFWQVYALRVTVVSPDELARRLEGGHRSEILREEWRNKVPSSVLAAGRVATVPVGVIPR